MSTIYPLQVPALRVDQPVGTFFAVVLKARTLLDVAYSDVVSARRESGGGSYEVDGAQRLSDPRRLDAIARYINRIDATFPSAIILAANMVRSDGRVEGDIDTDESEEGDEAKEDEELKRRWQVKAAAVLDADGEEIGATYSLLIPGPEKLAAVIDGQHRLFAFAKADPRHLDEDLLCSVFIDLPKSMQATIFATINSNQKAVDKSLTYELFGYNLSDEPEDQWSPEKLAVFLSRRIATDPDSAMRGACRCGPGKRLRHRRDGAQFGYEALVRGHRWGHPADDQLKSEGGRQQAQTACRLDKVRSFARQAAAPVGLPEGQ
ncbi:MAG: DGQHR domain-containing protein [Candidatus Sphingomonas phytovorans]|nr:DGQHR domain-containing protein [Sphingomonas sp.]WEJ99488.1 MAG: DGQHR domain-containing protein [Sphingomonas sp.]